MTSGYTCIFEHTETHSLCWLKQDEPSKKVNLSHTLNTNPANVMETADLSRYSALVVASVKASLHPHRLREEHRRKLDGGWLYVLQEEQDERFWRLSEEGKTADCIKTSKRVPKKHRDGENFKYSKTWCTDSITLSYYAIHLLLSKEN